MLTCGGCFRHTQNCGPLLPRVTHLLPTLIYNIFLERTQSAFLTLLFKYPCSAFSPLWHESHSTIQRFLWCLKSFLYFRSNILSILQSFFRLQLYKHSFHLSPYTFNVHYIDYIIFTYRCLSVSMSTKMGHLEMNVTLKQTLQRDYYCFDLEYGV